jgi:hypothetical protein
MANVEQDASNLEYLSKKALKMINQDKLYSF